MKHIIDYNLFNEGLFSKHTDFDQKDLDKKVKLDEIIRELKTCGDNQKERLSNNFRIWVFYLAGKQIYLDFRTPLYILIYDKQPPIGYNRDITPILTLNRNVKWETPYYETLVKLCQIN